MSLAVDEMALDELAVDEMAVDDLTPHRKKILTSLRLLQYCLNYMNKRQLESIINPNLLLKSFW